MNKRFDLYLFDFDQTLFFTLPSLEEIFVNSFASIGVKINKENILRYSRIPLYETYNEVCGDMSKAKDFEIAIRKLLDDDSLIKLGNVYSDTIDFLKFAKENKLSVGIVTSNTKEHVKKVLEFFNIDFDFDVIVGSDDVKTVKPDPGPILKALELLHFVGDMDKVCYVGDSINDALAAKNAYVIPYLLDRYNEYNLIKEYKIINKLTDLI